MEKVGRRKFILNNTYSGPIYFGTHENIVDNLVYLYDDRKVLSYIYINIYAIKELVNKHYIQICSVRRKQYLGQRRYR